MNVKNWTDAVLRARADGAIVRPTQIEARVFDGMPPRSALTRSHEKPRMADANLRRRAGGASRFGPNQQTRRDDRSKKLMLKVSTAQ